MPTSTSRTGSSRQLAAAAQDTTAPSSDRDAHLTRHTARQPERRTGRRPAAPVQAGPRWARPVLVRLGVLAVAMIAVQGLVQGTAREVVGGNPFDNGHPLALLLITVPGALLGLGIYTALVRRLEGRRVAELAPRAAVGGLARGALVGSVMFGAVLAVLAVNGSYRMTGTGPVSSVVTALALAVSAGVVEELTFRGVLFRLVETRLGTWGALAVSAVLFGAVHLANPHATVWSAIAIALEAGVMLGAAYAATRTLWVPIGLHTAWNLVQSVSGAPVSGTGGDAPSLITASFPGSSVLTGGAFGPEAGLPALVVGCAAAAVFLFIAARRGRLRPADLRRTSTGAPSGN